MSKQFLAPGGLSAECVQVHVMSIKYFRAQFSKIWTEGPFWTIFVSNWSYQRAEKDAVNQKVLSFHEDGH